MSLDETRRGFPTYRAASGAVPARGPGRRIESRGFRISYDDAGEGSAVVLVSGFSQSGADWWELGYVDRLVALGQRVLVVDPLGHGSSDRPHDPDAYRWPAVALDIVSVMDDAGAARATLWGFSRGAVLAATVAIEAPERVDALVLGAGGDLEAPVPSTLSPWIEALRAGDWAAFFDSPAGSIYAETTRRYHERVNDPRAFGALAAGRRLFPYTLDFGRITAPALVYVGGEDEPDGDRRTAEAIGAEFHELAGLDHRTGLSDTATVMAVVEPFLASTAGAATAG